MVFPNIEKIKQEYTDKYVVVDAKRPELARFADVVGQVKTVNMSGRALVEFLDYHLNIGWFDIELEYLKVVDKPQPKAKEEKKPAPKAEAKKPEAKAAAPAAKPAAAGKPSTADILAKLRGGAGAAPAAPAAKTEAPKPKAESAPAIPAKAGAPAKIDRSKMSVADMLASARGGSAAAPAAKQEATPAPEPKPAPAPAPAAEAGSPPKQESAPAAKSEGGIVKIDKSGMSIDQMVAYCREKDAS